MQTVHVDVYDLLKTFVSFCGTQNIQAWLVGGATRDLALHRTPHDLDVAVAANGVELARTFANTIGAAFVPLDEPRGVGRVVCTLSDPDASGTDTLSSREHITIDLAQLRAPTLIEDLRLRDFTMNALALPLLAAKFSVSGTSFEACDFIDPCGGLADITKRVVRACSPTSLSDDPLRLLRAVRIAAELHFTIGTDLEHDIQNNAAQIVHVAAERIRDELLKLLSVAHSTPWLRYLDDMGILTQLFPELEPARECEQPIVHFLPVLAHSLEAVTCVEWLLEGLCTEGHSTPHPQNLQQSFPKAYSPIPVAVQQNPQLSRTFQHIPQLRAHFAAKIAYGHPRAALFKLATLLHDNAKPQTKQPKADGGVSFHDHQQIGANIAIDIAQRLRLSRHNVLYIGRVVREHMRPGQLRRTENVTPRALARLLRDTGTAAPDVLLHAMADFMAARGPMIDPEDWQAAFVWTGEVLSMYWGKSTTSASRLPLVNGHDLIAALSMQPGKHLGNILREIRDAQAAGEIQTRAEALELARQMLEETPLPNLSS